MAQTTCSRCEKAPDLCVCSSLVSVPTNIHVLILQHPQEPDKDLGSARLAHLCLPNSTLRVGLSWRNLKAALGKEAIPSHWIALHLGSGIRSSSGSIRPGSLEIVSKKGEPQHLDGPVDGIVVLDGTWSQAKTLWWRNPWLLKLKRGILTPLEKSLYRELRREPRRECLSTLESVAEALVALGEPEATRGALKKPFAELLKNFRNRKIAR